MKHDRSRIEDVIGLTRKQRCKGGWSKIKVYISEIIYQRYKNSKVLFSISSKEKNLGIECGGGLNWVTLISNNVLNVTSIQNLPPGIFHQLYMTFVLFMEISCTIIISLLICMWQRKAEMVGKASTIIGSRNPAPTDTLRFS